MNEDTPITSAAWNAAKEQTDTNDNPDWCCVAHDMRDKCAELERDAADQAKWAKHYLDAYENVQRENARLVEQVELFRRETVICADCDGARKAEYDAVVAALNSVRAICTADHESKQSFIRRVLLCLPNVKIREPGQ